MGASESSRYSSVGSETSAGKTRLSHFLQMKRKRKMERNYSVDRRLNQDNAIKIRGKVGNINIVYNGERSSGHCVYRRRKKGRESCKPIDENVPTSDDHFSSWNSFDDDQSLQSLSQQTTFIDRSDKIFTKSSQNERHSKRCSIFSFPGTCLFNVEKLMPSVCNIELDGLTLGTGFRIGRRFVMTAYHVLEFCIDDFRLLQHCKASFPSLGVFSFANIEFVDKQKDVLILSLQCHDDKTLPAPLTLSEESEDSDSAVYITQNPSTASGRSGSPGIVLDKDGRPVVTVMHIESSFKSKTAMLHHIRHPIVCHRNWFVKISHRDYNGHNSSMTMKRLAHLFQDYGEGAVKEKFFGDLYDDSDKFTAIFCERYCYEDTFMMVVGSAGCGKSSFIKTLTDSWKPADNDNHYPDIIVFAFAASDSDALPTDEIERVLSQYKQHGPHIYGVMTKMDLVTEDEITKKKKNQIMSQLGLKEDSFSYWINKVPSNEKVNAADNVNPVVVRIENDMEKLKEVLKKRTTKEAEEFESEESFKDIRKLGSDLSSTDKLDLFDFNEDQDNFAEDHGWQVTQESQQTSINSTFSTCDCEYPSYNGMEREKILLDGENNDIRFMPQQIGNGEGDETQVKSSDVRHIQPVLQTGNSSKDLTREDSNTLSTNQRNITVDYCTSVYTEQSKSPGTMCTSVSNFTKDISSDDKKDNFSQAEYTPITHTLNMLVDRKLNGPESSMPYVSKQQERSLIHESDKDENLSAVIHLKTLKIEPRKGASEICDRKPDDEMFCNEYFNIKMKEDCDFVSVQPEEEIQESASEIIVEDNIGLETDEITSDDDNKMINSTETEEVQTHLKELNYVAGKMEFGHSKEILERLRRLMNIRQDFTSIKWTKFHVNPAPKDTQPANLFGSQEQSSNNMMFAHTEENENHTSDPRIPHGLDRSEQITSGMTGSSVSTPFSQGTRQHHYQTQSSDSSMLSSGNTGIPDSFSRNTSSSMNGLLSSLRSGSQEEVLRYEWGRFRTFWSYPLDCPVNPTNLARRGWFYEGNDDETVCFSCKVKHAHWRMGEDIDAIHAQISPLCPFINGQESGNVPIHGNPTPSVPANSNQGAVGGASYVNENSRSSNARVDHEPTSLLTRNLQLSGGGDQNTSQSFVQQSTGSAQIAPRTPATASQIKLSINRNDGASAPSTSTTSGTATGNVAANPTRLVAQPTSTPAIFLQTSVPGRPSVNQTPGSAPIKMDFQPQPQANSKNSQPPSNQQHPTTPRQIIEERQRQSQRRQEETQRNERQQGNQHPTNNGALGINTERPRYPNYAIVTVRAGTFGGFPTYLDQTPMQMAKAGFFYAGYGDYVRCFFCGGGLRNWEPGDDPWVEHARWFPRCTFVKHNKGQAFINLVLQRQRELLLPNISVPTEAQPQLPQAGVPHSVDLQSSAVQSIKEMGYSDSKIQRAIVRFRAQRGHDIPLTAQPLLEILFMLTTEDEEAEATIDVPSGIIQNNQSQRTQSQSVTSQSQTQTQTSQNQSQTTQSQPQNNPQVPGADKGEDQTKSSSPSQQSQQPAAISTVGQEASGSGKQATVELGASGALPDDDQSRVFSVEELRSIQDENVALKEQMKCKICMDNNVSISFLPCGHLCCCAECAPAMVRCPICRNIIRGSVKTYLS